MKIAIIGPSYPLRGGIVQYTDALADALASRHEVLILSFSRLYPSLFFPGRSQFDPGGHKPSCQSLAVVDSVAPLSWRRTGREAARFKPDLLCLQWWHPFFAPALWGVIRSFRRRWRAPVILLCHNIFPHEPLPLPGGSRLERVLISLAFRQADGFLVHSESMAGQVRRFCPSARVRKVFLPSYTHYRRWDTPAPAGVSDRPRLLFFGNIRPYKGLHTLLEALGQLRDRLDFQLVVAGEFYVDPDPYRRLAERLDIADRVVWRETYIPDPEVPRLFRQSDLVVLPYREGTQSAVVPLAFQFEVPVISTDVGGLREVVKEGETGYLVPPEDPAALAERIRHYFENGEKTRLQQGIRRFQRELSWQQVIDKMLDLSQEVGQGTA